LSVETTKYLINTNFYILVQIFERRNNKIFNQYKIYIQKFERTNNKISNQYKFLYTKIHRCNYMLLSQVYDELLKPRQ